MAVAHLLDTSVITRLHIEAVADAVEQLPGEVGRARITDLEVGYSARNAAEWDLIHDSLGGLTAVELEPRHLVSALATQRLLAAAGQRGRKIPDLLIAAAATDTGATTVHYDRDFDLIAAVTGQPTMWVVPAGTVD